MIILIGNIYEGYYSYINIFIIKIIFFSFRLIYSKNINK